MGAGVVADTIPFHLFFIFLGRFYDNDHIFVSSSTSEFSSWSLACESVEHALK